MSLINNSYISDIIKNKGFSDIQKDLSQHPWELYVTLGVADDSDESHTDRAFKKWRRHLIQRARCEIAYKGFYLTRPNKHFHLLLLSRRSRKRDKGLTDLEPDTIQALCDLWRSLMYGRSADIASVYNIDGVAGYLTGPRNLSRGNQEWTQIETNLKLLKRKKKKGDKQ